MVIYLAASAPGNETKHEEGMLILKNRLLSYFLVQKNQFECGNVFTAIIKFNNSKTIKQCQQ